MLPLLAGLAACGSSDPPVIDVEVIRDVVDLGTTDYTRQAPPSGDWSLLNVGRAAILVSVAGVEGEGAEFLDWSLADFTELDPGESATVSLQISDDRRLWEDGAYEPELVVQLGNLFDDPRDFDQAGDWSAEERRVSVTFTLDCDLDNDGSEALACGGQDCSDDDPGTTDATWYLDFDGDGYGDPAVAASACIQPSGHVKNDWDCDDGDASVAPAAIEVCNGTDDDCDGVVDENCTPTTGDTGAPPLPTADTGTTVGMATGHTGSTGDTGTPPDTADTGLVAGTADTGAAGGNDTAAPGFAIVVNEILADPPDGVDANCDGAPDTAADEFVEIANAGTVAVDLDGATLSDGTAVRHTFGAVVLPPGATVVVFGGGVPTFDGTGTAGAWCASWPIGVAATVASTGGLDLDDAGDTVTLTGPLGATLDQYTYPPGVVDQSGVRWPELDAASSMVPHTMAPGAVGAFSPGRRVDGSAL